MNASQPVPARPALIGRLAVAVLAWVAIMIFATLFNLNVIVPTRGLAFDFYPHWAGGRALWSGQSPYQPHITRQTQQDMFGGLLPPQADQHNVAYPAYTGVLLAPVLWLPAPVAIAVWMTIQLFALFIAPIIWLSILQWRPSPPVTSIVLAAMIFGFHYPLDTFMLAQFSGTVLLAISLGTWLLIRRRDAAAGLVMVLAAVPPTVGGPLALALLGGYALLGRWRGLAVFIAALVVLTGISVALVGWWLPEWLSVLSAYSVYAPPVWPPSLLTPPLCYALVLLAAGLTLWMTARLVRLPNTARQADFAIAALLAALLLLPQTGYYYLVLLLPVLTACAERARTLPPGRRAAAWLVCAGMTVSPWLYFALPGITPAHHSLIMPLQAGLLWAVINVRAWLRVPV